MFSLSQKFDKKSRQHLATATNDLIGRGLDRAGTSYLRSGLIKMITSVVMCQDYYQHDPEQLEHMGDTVHEINGFLDVVDGLQHKEAKPQ